MSKSSKARKKREAIENRKMKLIAFKADSRFEQVNKSTLSVEVDKLGRNAKSIKNCFYTDSHDGLVYNSGRKHVHSGNGLVADDMGVERNSTKRWNKKTMKWENVKLIIVAVDGRRAKTFAKEIPSVEKMLRKEKYAKHTMPKKGVKKTPKPFKNALYTGTDKKVDKLTTSIRTIGGNTYTSAFVG